MAFEALSSLKAVLLHVRRAASSLQRPAAATAGAVPGRRGGSSTSSCCRPLWGRRQDGVTLGLQKQPPTLEPDLWTVDCHHLGSGPLFYPSSLCSRVPGAAPSCPGLKAPVALPKTGRAGGRRALLLHPLAPGKYREVWSTESSWESLGLLSCGTDRTSIAQQLPSGLKTCIPPSSAPAPAQD